MHRPPYILTHETGHVLANLSDEYTYTNPYPGFPTTEEPNTTQQTNRTLIKWNAWISPARPFPRRIPPATVSLGCLRAPTTTHQLVSPGSSIASCASWSPFLQRLQRSPGAGHLSAGAARGWLFPRQHELLGFHHASPGLQPVPAPTRHA